MPVIFDHTFDGGTLAVWQCSEALAELEALCTPEERSRAAVFLRDARRKEWLAWHALLHRMAPGAVAEYDAAGAPVLHCGEPTGKQVSAPVLKSKVPAAAQARRPVATRHIGVSHTGAYVAVIFADRPCAIDIELPQRDFSRAASRFISDTERALIDKGPLTEGKVWCAKEAMFKWARTPDTDFLRDMAVTAAPPPESPESRTLSLRPPHTHLAPAAPAAAPASHSLTGTIRGREVTLHDLSTEELTIIFCCE